MSHVADGDLHAYLDGALDQHSPGEADRIRAHLESCPECRRRLEEEERLRNRAGDILSRTDPGPVEMPPFEEVRRRAAMEAAGRVRSRRPWVGVGLGWAASVILALGAGWMAGHESTAVSGRVGVAAARSSQDEGAGAPADAGAPDQSAERSAAVRDEAGAAAGGESRVADALGAADRDVANVASDEQMAEAPRPAAPVAAEAKTLPADEPAVARAAEPELAAAPTGALADSVASGAVGTVVGQVVQGGTGAPLAGAQVTVEGTALGTLTDQEGRYRLSVPAGSRSLRLTQVGFGAVADTVLVRPGETAVVDFAPPATAVALDALVVTVAPDSAAARRQVFAARVDSITIAPTTFDARRADRVSAQDLALPGLTVLQVAWTEVAPGVDGLLVVQRLAADTTRVELRFGGLDRGVAEPAAEREEARADVPRALLDEGLPEGVHQVWARLPERGGWVVLRSRLPRERLERLLDLLR